MTPDLPAEVALKHPDAGEIAEAAANLSALRDNWLWPANLCRLEPELGSGFPDRRLPVDSSAADVLRGRTLTALYNNPPEWLQLAHARLDAAVARAYGFDGELNDTAMLELLLTLNLQRSANI
jgi:hypothetical protein